jgi:hydroxypyruvate isomerase
MARFSANLGFLWTERTLPEAICQAKRAGFDAVECHWPYETPAIEVLTALRETGLPMLGLNTRMGKNGSADFGVAALRGREVEARVLIDEAIVYASAIFCRYVHVMSGKAQGAPGAEKTFRANLGYAADRAALVGVTILIEPINQRDAPGYHLSLAEAAAETIAAVGRPNIKMMFDCYHAQIMRGDLTKRIEALTPIIGHIQIAAVPDRGEPDGGEICYRNLLQSIDDMGYRGFIGAEYRPRRTTDSGLAWLSTFRDIRGESARQLHR